MNLTEMKKESSTTSGCKLVLKADDVILEDGDIHPHHVDFDDLDLDEPTCKLLETIKASSGTQIHDRSLCWPGIGAHKHLIEDEEERQSCLNRMTDAVRVLLECLGEDVY